MIDQAEPAGFAPEKNVGAHVEIVGQVQLLMDECHTVAERGLNGIQLDGFSINADFARVRRLHAGKDFHERAFARAIFADYRKHFTRSQREVHAAEGFHAGKLFADLLHLEQGC